MARVAADQRFYFALKIRHDWYGKALQWKEIAMRNAQVFRDRQLQMIARAQ